MRSQDKPSLYGITPENSNRTGEALWGKNQFNSAFPLSLCLYMRDKGMSPIAVISTHGDIKPRGAVWKMCDVIGGKDDVPLYLFETAFKPFAQLSRNQIDKIDLVVAYHRKHIRPLEVKPTVVPDLATVGKNREFWAPEIVIRPVSSAYAMFGVATSLMQMK